MKRATRIATMAVLALLAAPALGQSAAPDAVFTLEPWRKTVALRGKVRGVEGLFAFDTAGGLSLLSPALAAKIGCTPWGRLSGHRMMGDRLDGPRCDEVAITLGTTTFAPRTALVLDIMQFYPAGASPVDGLVALDVFDGRVITIDFPGKRLILESEASLAARVQDLKPLPVSLSREIQGRALAASVGVPTAQGHVWLELDSGNGGTLLIAQPYATLFGLDPAKEGPQDGDFEIAPGLRAQGPTFAPDKMILDGNIGMPFLKDKIVTLDLARGRLWIEAPRSEDDPGA